MRSRRARKHERFAAARHDDVDAAELEQDPGGRGPPRPSCREGPSWAASAAVRPARLPARRSRSRQHDRAGEHDGDHRAPCTPVPHIAGTAPKARARRTRPGSGRREPDGRPGRLNDVSATSTPPPYDTDGPLVYSLDRRDPNDPKLGSIHVVVALLTSVLAALAVVVL